VLVISTATASKVFLLQVRFNINDKINMAVVVFTLPYSSKVFKMFLELVYLLTTAIANILRLLF